MLCLVKESVSQSRSSNMRMKPSGATLKYSLSHWWVYPRERKKSKKGTSRSFPTVSFNEGSMDALLTFLSTSWRTATIRQLFSLIIFYLLVAVRSFLVCGPSLVNQFLRKGRRSTVQAFNIIDGSKKREGEEEDRSVNPSFIHSSAGLFLALD